MNTKTNRTLETVKGYDAAALTKTQTGKRIINVTHGTAVKPSSSFHSMFAENQIGDCIELRAGDGRTFTYLVVAPEQADGYARS